MKENVSGLRHAFSAEGRVQRTQRNERAEGKLAGKFHGSMKAKRAHLSPKHLARRYTGRLLPALGAAARRCGGDGSFLVSPSPVEDISHSRDTAA